MLVDEMVMRTRRVPFSFTDQRTVICVECGETLLVEKEEMDGSRRQAIYYCDACDLEYTLVKRNE